MRKYTLATFILAILLIGTYIQSSPIILKRRLMIKVPSVIMAKPGEEVLIKGEIYNLGNTWLHKLNFTLEGLPFEYEIRPSYLKDLPVKMKYVLGEGWERLPTKFYMRIFIPSNASGNYNIMLKLQEHFTALKVYNITTFNLMITGYPNISISEISYIPKIIENNAFDINVTLKNTGFKKATAAVEITLPETWLVDKKSKTIEIDKNSTALLTFSVLPTSEIGNFSLTLRYTYDNKTEEKVEFGPILIPIPKEEAPTKVEWRNVALFIFGLIFLVLVFRYYRLKKVRKKPEEVRKKKGTITLSSESEQINI